MNSSVLVDTNILIYGVDVDSQFHDRALNILLDPELRLFTTSKNVSKNIQSLSGFSPKI